MHAQTKQRQLNYTYIYVLYTHLTESCIAVGYQGIEGGTDKHSSDQSQHCYSADQ